MIDRCNCSEDAPVRRAGEVAPGDEPWLVDVGVPTWLPGLSSKWGSDRLLAAHSPMLERERVLILRFVLFGEDMWADWGFKIPSVF